MGYRLGIDVGGTFTDVVMLREEDGRLFYAKVPSVPGQQNLGVVRGIRKALDLASAAASEIRLFVHGTTVATNALLEGKGARVGMVTTRGFRDVLQIGRQDRPSLYDFHARRPEPLVPREWRLEAEERTLKDGSVVRPLDPDEVRRLAGELRRAGVESVVVAFLHSYANPENERLAGRVLAEEMAGCCLSLSSQVLPEYREYERFSTAAVTAYVEPVLRRYLLGLERDCREMGMASDVYVMQSNGGLMPAASARNEQAVHTVMSGPAGGVLAAGFIGKLIGSDNVMAVDMGGTSFDVSLIKDGQVSISVDNQVAGYPLRAPMFDIVTLGAGGGSIAWIDAGGIMKVGPESAGARPGPACYGLGGHRPTVTDANLLLGRLDPDRFLGGEMALDVDAAHRALEEHLARPLGLSVEEAALGVIEIVNANMLRGMRLMTTRRGHDPRDFALMAFGGAAPAHAADLAAAMSMPRVVFPTVPGLACALGLLVADVKHYLVASFLRPAAGLAPADLAAGYAPLEEQARRQAAAEGIPAEPLNLLRLADVRYAGQGYELTVEAGAGGGDEVSARFAREHRRLFGYCHEGSPAEVVNLRLVSTGATARPAFAPGPVAGEDPSAALVGRRRANLGEGYLDCPVYDRSGLRPGNCIRGPALVVQMDSTLVLKGRQTTVDPYGNLILEL